MGHLNVRDLIKCHEDKSVCGTDLKKVDREFVCETCVRGKMVKTPFPKNEPRNSEILEIIHSDVCGPMRSESNGGARYVITFIDDYSRWCEIRLLRRKDEVLTAFKDFKMKIENYHSKRIKFLQTDNGKEYCNTKFNNFLRESGIQRRLTVTHTPEQNGVAERRNRTLLDMTRCLLIDSGLSQSFWGEAISTANYLRNRCPSRSLKGKTPFEKWNNRVPDVSHLRPFGTEVFTVDRDSTKGKLDPRSKKGILMGYSDQSKGYRIWLTSKRKIDVARDVRFMEKVFTLSQVEAGVDVLDELEEADAEEEEDEAVFPPPAVERDDSQPEENEIEQDLGEPRRGRGRPEIIRTGQRGRPRKRYNVVSSANSVMEESLIAEIPLEEAIRGPDSKEWLHAMADEIKSIYLRTTPGQLSINLQKDE